ncbi:MAG: MurR/RpiR family transcriptional regulator [Bacillus sp. (in: firmicutes)]
MFTNEVIASFNELETSIYKYICENTNKVVYMRIRELAEETHVSTATILRFCRKTGCDGFPEFKARLKLSVQKKQQPDLKSSEYLLTEFVERTLKGNIHEHLEKAATIITSTERVIFIGTGSSGILAEYGARYFSSIGKLSLFINDPHFPIHDNCFPNSTTIALSVTGENPFTIAHLNQLKGIGTKIVSITNNEYSTIAKMADTNISYYMTEQKIGNANITTQVPVIYMLEALAQQVYSIMKKKNKQT